MDLVLEFEPLLLAAVRVTVFLVLAPPFSHGAVPGAVKAMLGVGLAFALSPELMAATGSAGAFLLGLVGEAVIGGGLALLVTMVFAAVQSAGRLIDVLGGFEIGVAFDPMTMMSGAPFGKLYAMSAIVLLFASDGYQLVIAGLARSFDALPLGTGLDVAVLAESMTGAVTQMFLAAIQVAGPLIAVLFLADVGLGLLTRVAPALNAFALGFPLKIFISLSLGVFAVIALPRVVAWLADEALSAVVGVTG